MDLNDGLAIRLRRDRVVVSTDAGDSTSFGGAQAAQLRSLLEQFGTGEPTFRSAALIASIAEARAVRPRPSPIPLGRGADPIRPPEDGGLDLGPRVSEIKAIHEVLRLRRSIRPTRPCNIADLATLLFHSARTIDEWSSEDGTRLAHRPYPSAGARHPIGITVVANDVEGLAAGAWDFDPVHCRLQPSDWHAETVARIVGAATAALGGVTPPTLVVAIAEPDRTVSRYPAGTAHLWRDAGAMLTTVHIVAAAIGLRSSIVGIGGQIGDETDNAIDVGAVAVGR